MQPADATVRYTRPLFGTATASVPPGRSTRRISDSISWVSSTCCRTWMHVTASKRESSNGRRPAAPICSKRAPGMRHAPARSRPRRVRPATRAPGALQLRGEPPVAAADVEHARPGRSRRPRARTGAQARRPHRPGGIDRQTSSNSVSGEVSGPLKGAAAAQHGGNRLHHDREVEEDAPALQV